ncbi:MAG: cytochrome c oxidase subunit 4 [Ilumatobacteraceae bacterium]
MRVEATIWTATAVFFAALAALYVAVGGEAAGTSLLGIGFAFGGIIAVWLWRRVRTEPVPPEDRAAADMSDDAGSVGTFVVESWRPIGIAAGAAVALVGLVVGPWLAIIGALFAMFHLTGLVRDVR